MKIVKIAIPVLAVVFLFLFWRPIYAFTIGAPSPAKVREVLEERYPSSDYKITDIEFSVKINHDMAGRKTDTKGFGYTMVLEQTEKHPKGSTLPAEWQCILFKREDGDYFSIAAQDKLFNRVSD